MYKTGYQCLLQFLVLSGTVVHADSLPVLSEDVLIYFVTYCHKSLHLQWNTIKLYLAGIRFHYLHAGLPNPLASVDRLQCILRGIQRSQRPTTRSRFPITFHILNQICDLLSQGAFTPRLDFTLQCMCLLAYFGFLRCGEFTVKSLDNNVDPCLKRKDITFATDGSMFNLRLPTSKTDPFRIGVDIPIYRNNNIRWCPVLMMDKYLRQCGECIIMSSLNNSEAPLFVYEEGKPFTRNKFLSYLKQVMCRLGYDEQKYSGHSFRVGAATSAAAAKLEDHMIQTLGRWSSSCYTTYIRVRPDDIQAAQARMCHTQPQ